MPTEIPLPPDPPTDAPPPPARPKIKCEYCECALTPTGDVYQMSAKAREINKQTETLHAVRADLATAQADVQRLTTELRQALAAKEPKKKFAFGIDSD